MMSRSWHRPHERVASDQSRMNLQAGRSVSEVQVQLLTSIVKLFLQTLGGESSLRRQVSKVSEAYQIPRPRKPSSTQDMVSKVLKCATEAR